MATFINDIRISGMDKLAQRIHELEPKQAPFVMWHYRNLAERYALKLLSLEFATGPENVFILKLDFDKPFGSVEPEHEGICSSYSCGMDVMAFALLDEGHRHMFFINAIHSMLSSIAKLQGLEISKVDSVRDLLIAYGDRLEITRASKTTQKYDLRVSFTVAALPQLILTVKDKASEQSTSIRVIELDDFADAYKLAARVSVRAGAIFIYPRQTELGRCTLKRYWQRLDTANFHSGTADFIEIPLSAVLQTRI